MTRIVKISDVVGGATIDDVTPSTTTVYSSDKVEEVVAAIELLEGPAGPTGPQGPAGATGPQGPAGTFTGTMDDITDGTTYVKTENNLTDALVSTIGSALQSETSHADVLVDADIGVTVQGYDANLMRFFISNEATDANKSITGDNQLVLINTARDAVIEVDFTIGTLGCLLIVKVVSVNTGWECSLTGCGFSEALHPADVGLTRIFVSDGTNYVEIARYISGVSIPTVSDIAYDAGTWDGNTDAPTKNAVRDKFESLSIPTALSSLSEDTTHRLVTDAEKTSWNAKLSAMPEIPVTRQTISVNTTINSGYSGYVIGAFEIPALYDLELAGDLEIG